MKNYSDIISTVLGMYKFFFNSLLVTGIKKKLTSQKCIVCRYVLLKFDQNIKKIYVLKDYINNTHPYRKMLDCIVFY